jgi:hypothetical protein
MKEVKLNGHRVELFASIEELPIVRFHKYNKCMLVDAGLGSDLTAFDAHIERVVRYIRADKREEAAKELENMRQGIYMIIQELSPQHIAFACLVARIDGKAYNDLSDEGLNKVMELLGGTPTKDIAAQSEAVKKKIDDELTLYFPAIFDDARSKELYDILKQRAKTMLDCIIDGETQERTKRVEELTDMMITFSKPKNFTGTGSLEIEYDKQFEDMCLLISQNLHMDAKKMNVLEYYNAYQFIERQTKAQKAQNKAR